jgi:hypothetical protein
MAALVCLGVYAAVVAWNQFRPRPSPAKSVAHVRQSATILAPSTTREASAQAKPAGKRQPVNAPDATTHAPSADETSVAPTATAAPADDIAMPDADQTGAPQPSPVVDAPTASTERQQVSLIAALAARLWERSQPLVRQGVQQAIQNLEQYAKEAAETQEQLAQQNRPANAEPAVPPVDATPDVKTAQATGAVLINPSDSGGVVHYLVDGAAYSLHPGQMHLLDSERAPRVEFHRGGAFGDAVLDLVAGRYVFHVTQRGWTLEATGGQQ